MLAIFLVASHAAGFAGAARNIVLEDALYWTPHPGHNPIHPGTYEHAVYAADLDGTNVRLVRNFTGQLAQVQDVAVDDAAGIIIVSEEGHPPNTFKIVSGNSNGVGEIKRFANQHDWVHTLALDTVNRKVYWEAQNTLRCANYDGSRQEDLIRDFDNIAGDGQRMALDVASGTIYTAVGSVLNKWTIAGAVKVTLLKSGDVGGKIQAVDVDHTRRKLYFAVEGKGIWRCNLDGSDPEPLPARIAGSFRSVLVYRDRYLFYHADGSNIYRADLDGKNQVRVLALARRRRSCYASQETSFSSTEGSRPRNDPRAPA